MVEDNILNVALVEFNAVWEDVPGNLAALETVFRGLFSGGFPLRPDLVALPEFFAAGYTMNPRLAEPSSGGMTLSWMKRMALEYGCAVAGSVPVTEGGRRYNRMYFVFPAAGLSSGGHGEESCVHDGTVVYHYDKSHMFFGGETDNYCPGSHAPVFSFRGWRIRPGICFDLRFPEWSRNSGVEPYDLYLNVANWPAARNAAADVLVKARSIENVCWSVFCNRTGADELLEYSGNSAVVDHRGRSRGKSQDVGGTSVVYASISKEPMYRFREGFPVLEKIVGRGEC